MSIDLDDFGIIVLWIRPCAVELSVVTGVFGCLWPISSSVMRRGTAALRLYNRAASSDLEADDMTCLMTDDNVTMAPLLKSSSPLFPSQKWPPALLLALGSER